MKPPMSSPQITRMLGLAVSACALVLAAEKRNEIAMVGPIIFSAPRFDVIDLENSSFNPALGWPH